MSGAKLQRARRNVLIAVILILIIVFSGAYYWKIGTSRSTMKSESSQTSIHSSTSTTSLGSQTSFGTIFTICCDTTDTAQLSYPIAINYNGSWNLRYWIEDSRQNIVLGDLNGSGSFSTTITFYVVGLAAETLCANATELNPQNNLTLILSVSGQSNSTNASIPTTEACGSMGV